MIELNQVLAYVLRWLLIGVLFAAPIAIAKHQFEHHDTAQPIEQCKLCAHSQSIDNNSTSTTHVCPTNIINLGIQANKLTTNLQQEQVNHFLSRAPPR